MDELKGKNVRVREGQWHYRFKFRGREHSGCTGLDGVPSNQSAAEEFARRAREQVERLGPSVVARSAEVVRLVGGAVRFTAAAEQFLTWCRESEYRRAPSTAERIRVSFQSAMAHFGDRAVNTIDAVAIEGYKGWRLGGECSVRGITVRHDLHALAVFFKKYAMKRGMAKANPVAEVSIPSDRDAIREHVITPAEEERYFAAAARLHAIHVKSVKDALPNMADLARLMLEQGARPEELLAARACAFDGGGRTLKIEGGKTRSARRTLYLTPASMAIMERRAALPSEWLFPSDRHPGHHLGPMNATHDRICIEAGVSFCVYDCRHTFATRAIEAGVPVAVVAAILGHSGLRTIHRYVHPSAEAQRAAMERARKVVG